MAHLNWRSAAIQQAIGPHPKLGSQMTISVPAAEKGALLSELEEVFVRSVGELRVDMHQNWVMFWKRRDSESRLLLAHPNPNEWVATLALEIAHGAAMVQALGGLNPGHSVALSSLGKLGSVSNCEWVLTLI